MNHYLLLLCGIVSATANVDVASAQGRRSQPSIRIESRPPVILGDDISVRLEGLTSGVAYELRLDAVNEWGTAYRSTNVFVAGPSGVVDVSRDPPARGSYTGADHLGIFWSATRLGDARNVGPLDVPADSISVTLTLSAEGKVLDSTRVVQWLLRAGATRREIRDSGVVAALYEPAGSIRRPLVVLIGGSGGGMTWQRQTAAVLASHGFAALAVAYFNGDGLPRSLSEIPLEYFEKAIRIAASSARVDSRRIAVMGLSRGAEAALLLAANFENISTVIDFAPSAFTWMGQRPPDYPIVTSWTLRGKAIPFVPTKEARPYSATDNEAERHLRYLITHPDSAISSVIPVERIRGPILLFSGGRDPIWPSSFMSDLIATRLKNNRFRYDITHFSYDNAGHAFARPGYVSTSPGGFSGGIPSANAYAQRDSWMRVLEHLRDWMGSAR